MKVRAETRKVENDTMQTLVKSNSRLSKIVVILPYFGEFPNYFDFFLQSCASNPTIDFLIISNRKIDCDAGNIHVENCSFEAFRQLVMDHFSYPVTLDKPYKLCDFKSYYGMILADQVKEYDFWGFCDCDLIFGDIRRFLTEDILTTHDFIFDMGQFQLHRVGDQNYLDVIDDYRGKDNLSAREILNLPRNFALDELPFGIPRDYYIRFPERFFPNSIRRGDACWTIRIPVIFTSWIFSIPAVIITEICISNSASNCLCGAGNFRKTTGKQST